MKSATQMTALTGITYRQLDHWCTKGWLRPVTQGFDRDRWFEWPEQLVLIAMAALVQAGVAPAAAAKAARGDRVALAALQAGVDAGMAVAERTASAAG